MCQYSDISSVEEEEEENSPSSGHLKENKNENMMMMMMMMIPPMYGDQQQQDYEKEEEEEEEALGDDDLTVNVFNFPSTYFYLKLERTKSFKHKQDEIVNEQSYIVGLKENLIGRNVTLGDIHNQLYLLFDSLLEEIHNVYTHQDLVRVYITHDEMVNTNIIVGPNYLGHITADVIMDRIASVVHSNNFIPANRGLQINIAAIKNIKGLASVEYQNDNLNYDLKKRFKTMCTNDHGNGHWCIFSLQKHTALEYQKRQ